MNILKEIKEQADELLNCGNSREQAEGHGMMRVLDQLAKYVKGFGEFETYFDSISDEEQSKLYQKLVDFGIYSIT